MIPESGTETGIVLARAVVIVVIMGEKWEGAGLKQRGGYFLRFFSSRPMTPTARIAKPKRMPDVPESGTLGTTGVEASTVVIRVCIMVIRFRFVSVGQLACERGLARASALAYGEDVAQPKRKALGELTAEVYKAPGK